MNTNQLVGNWVQIKGTVREKWGRLTDNDLGIIGGQRERLVGRVQTRYGKARPEAEREVDAFLTEVGEPEELF